MAQRAARHLGLPAPDILDIGTDDQDSASIAISDWYRTGVTGIIAYNDEIAAAVLRAALVAGYSIPDDMAVIGNDDSPLSRLYTPMIASVETVTDCLGEYITGVVLASVEGASASKVPVIHAELSASGST